MNFLSDAIQAFKDREDHEAALQILLDRPLLRYCGLWRRTLVTVVNEIPLGDSWNDLWECVTVDYERLADLADEPVNRARFQINRLRELQLIYPDGTKTAMARKAIVKFMTDELS